MLWFLRVAIRARTAQKVKMALWHDGKVNCGIEPVTSRIIMVRQSFEITPKQLQKLLDIERFSHMIVHT